MMNNILPFKPGKPSRRKRIQDAANALIDDCEESGQAFLAFKKKFLRDAKHTDRFALGMALFHEGINQIILSRTDNAGFSDEDVRCLVSVVVDGLLSEGLEIQ